MSRVGVPLFALALASCSPASETGEPRSPEPAPATFVEADPQPRARLSPPLAQLSFVPDAGAPNLLDPVAARGTLEHDCRLRAGAQARVRLDGQPRERESESWDNEHSVLAWDADGAGPVRFLYSNYRVAVGFWVERDQLEPRVRETAAVFNLAVGDPDMAEPARVRLSSATELGISLEAYDAGAALVPVSAGPDYDGGIAVSGLIAREDLDVVSRRGQLGLLEPTHYTREAEPLLAAPRDDAAVVARLDSSVDLVILTERDAEGWFEVLALEPGVVAHGYVRTASSEVYGVGGLGLRGTGRGGGGSTRAWLAVPADTPMFDEPEGVLSGRALVDSEFFIAERRGDWTAVELWTDWGQLDLWVELRP